MSASPSTLRLSSSEKDRLSQIRTKPGFAARPTHAILHDALRLGLDQLQEAKEETVPAPEPSFPFFLVPMVPAQSRRPFDAQNPPLGYTTTTGSRNEVQWEPLSPDRGRIQATQAPQALCSDPIGADLEFGLLGLCYLGPKVSPWIGDLRINGGQDFLPPGFDDGLPLQSWAWPPEVPLPAATLQAVTQGRYHERTPRLRQTAPCFWNGRVEANVWMPKLPGDEPPASFFRLFLVATTIEGWRARYQS